MPYQKPAQPNKPIIAIPADFSEDKFNEVVANFTNHFSNILTPQLIIASRKGCYACIINGTINGSSLETIAGTANAKIITDIVMRAVSAGISAVPVK